MSEQIPQPRSEAAQTAFGRLSEFDPAEVTASLDSMRQEELGVSQKDKRMNEMSEWANTVGYIAEEKAKTHHNNIEDVQRLIDRGNFDGYDGTQTFRQHLEAVNEHNSRGVELDTEANAEQKPTGNRIIDQDENGDVVTKDIYGTDPKILLRSPKNINQ